MASVVTLLRPDSLNTPSQCLVQRLAASIRQIFNIVLKFGICIYSIIAGMSVNFLNDSLFRKRDLGLRENERFGDKLHRIIMRLGDHFTKGLCAHYWNFLKILLDLFWLQWSQKFTRQFNSRDLIKIVIRRGSSFSSESKTYCRHRRCFCFS